MRCPECSAEVSALREFCPVCAAPLHRAERDRRPGPSAERSDDELKDNRKRVVVIGFGILLAVAIVGKLSWIGAAVEIGSHRLDRGAVTVQADDLFRAYRDNPHAADRRFGHREIVATGEFVRIAPDGNGDPDLRLKTSDPEQPLGIDMIRASFAQATQLKPGQTVTVSCQRVDRTGDERWLRNCAIESVKDAGAGPAAPTPPTAPEPPAG